MYHLKIESTFKKDTDRLKKRFPELQEELNAVFNDYLEIGFIRQEYNPHLLDDPKLPYYGDMEFHLFNDLLVIYVEVNHQNSIRFVRIGTHQELFHPNKNK